MAGFPCRRGSKDPVEHRAADRFRPRTGRAGAGGAAGPPRPSFPCQAAAIVL